ncbi:hypothetical protein GCM10018793_46100 [Streptomyces sulfonofaciens]|uniref:Uncharacterized protein n=1 Tax=Streptomyces sulfonofaciens TaxID=68272 RepID=A0A919GFE5_9ACTN|nr:hypothetical protein GCM10018793_46100 [Streptomyces sulfonofaciens]
MQEQDQRPLALLHQVEAPGRRGHQTVDGLGYGVLTHTSSLGSASGSGARRTVKLQPSGREAAARPCAAHGHGYDPLERSCRPESSAHSTLPNRQGIRPRAGRQAPWPAWPSRAPGQTRAPLGGR